VEVLQQFAWLGGALRSSPFESGIATCVPVVSKIKMNDEKSPAQGLDPSIALFCDIKFTISQLVMTAENSSGQCWHNMFRNPVMVNGFPTLKRHRRGMGLEMPLNLMALLAGTERATIFDGKIFLKGFSTMLIALRVMEDLLVWHYHYNGAGKRISYLDHDQPNTESIDLHQLQTTRHIVGWCSTSEYFAGQSHSDVPFQSQWLKQYFVKLATLSKSKISAFTITGSRGQLKPLGLSKSVEYLLTSSRCQRSGILCCWWNRSR
jgi:hypothetical protein